jgi:hypothetical protein
MKFRLVTRDMIFPRVGGVFASDPLVSAENHLFG